MSAQTITLPPPPTRAPSPPRAPAATAPPKTRIVSVRTRPDDDPPPDPLPDPRPLAENLARCVIEILAGTRDLDQIARWLSTDVHAHLMKRVVLSARARRVREEAPSRPTFSLGRAVVSEPGPGIVEAVVIVHGRARSRAVAIRLEQLGRRWRASAIHVL
jgi:hypothetical protein